MATTLFFKGSYSSIILSLIVLVVCGSNVWNVNCTEFEVGGHDGWVVPKSKDNDQMYNKWASQNRFKVGDTVRFKYEKDSVMVVTEQEYESCKATRPIFFSNNGDTLFKFDRPGVFYFISGVSGHCSRGQKMIIKVLDVHVPPPAPAPESQNVNATQPNSKSGASDMSPSSSIITTSALFVVSIFGLFYA